jgi:hypothetical protein
MNKGEYTAWLAEIDLAKPEGLPLLHKALCAPLPKGASRVDRRKRKFLRKLVNKRIKQVENRPGTVVYGPGGRLQFPQVIQY